MADLISGLVCFVSLQDRRRRFVLPIASSSESREMSSPASESPLDAQFPYRKDSFLGEEDGPLDVEISQVIEELRVKHPDCDRLGEINTVVAHLKQKLKESVEAGDGINKQAYMDKIVQLGLERQSLEDSGPQQEVIRFKGHDFEIQPSRGRRNPCCEVCLKTIWRMIQSWRRCAICGFRVHDKCIPEVPRICAGVHARRPDFAFTLTIAEQKGLDAQDFACAECLAPLRYEGPACQEPRLCDYTGLLFCPTCHWGDKWSMPARILLNMDATPRPVCRAVKQLLSIVDARPLIDISTANPSLFKYHKDLRRLQQIRRNFLFMKCYFVSCKNARKLRILQYLNQHQHFVENAEMYSLSELRALCDGQLLPEMEDIHSVFQKHIEEECETCKGNGFFCELCEDPKTKNEVIYPFTEGVAICPECVAVFHSKCFERRSLHCPRCERRKKRAPVSWPDDDSSS